MTVRAAPVLPPKGVVRLRGQTPPGDVISFFCAPVAGAPARENFLIVKPLDSVYEVVQ